MCKYIDQPRIVDSQGNQYKRPQARVDSPTEGYAHGPSPLVADFGIHVRYQRCRCICHCPCVYPVTFSVWFLIAGGTGFHSHPTELSSTALGKPITHTSGFLRCGSYGTELASTLTPAGLPLKGEKAEKGGYIMTLRGIDAPGIRAPIYTFRVNRVRGSHSVHGHVPRTQFTICMTQGHSSRSSDAKTSRKLFATATDCTLSSTPKVGQCFP